MNTAAQPLLKRHGAKINLIIAICCGMFIVVLALAAYWDRSIRMLHLFEALPYLIAATRCFQYSKFGYALGFSGGAFWLWIAGTLTSFVRNGFEQLVRLVRTGHVDRPDILIAAPATLATAGLVLFSLGGYALLPKRRSDVVIFVLALLLVAGFFVGIFAAFAPQYLGIFRQLSFK
jgi:hypothetical protein